MKELAPGRASPGSRITEFPIPTVVSYPWGITAGSDGNLWFTEQNRSKIGQITTAGALRESRAKPGLNPEGITSGPDGNIWFTAAGDNAIVEFRML